MSWNLNYVSKTFPTSNNELNNRKRILVSFLPDDLNNDRKETSKSSKTIPI